jgi:hypothetical protein
MISETPQTTKPKRSRGGCAIATVIAVVMIFASIWFVKEASETLSRIFPGRSLAPSSSMKPYELSFKKATENGGVDEWKLAIPRAFVIDQTGQNGDIAPWTGTNTSYFSATVNLLRNTGGQLVPESAVENPKEFVKKNRILIHLVNYRADSRIVRENLCLPQHVQLDGESRVIGSCYDRDSVCGVTSHMDGWSLGIAATKDLFRNPLEVCEIAKKFLNQYTVSRSSIVPRN